MTGSDLINGTRRKILRERILKCGFNYFTLKNQFGLQFNTTNINLSKSVAGNNDDNEEKSQSLDDELNVMLLFYDQFLLDIQLWDMEYKVTSSIKKSNRQLKNGPQGGYEYLDYMLDIDIDHAASTFSYLTNLSSSTLSFYQNKEELFYQSYFGISNSKPTLQICQNLAGLFLDKSHNSNVSSGIIILTKLLILDEIDKMFAWKKIEMTSAIKTLRDTMTNELNGLATKTILETSLQTACIISPVLGYQLTQRYPLLSFSQSQFKLQESLLSILFRVGNYKSIAPAVAHNSDISLLSLSLDIFSSFYWHLSSVPVILELLNRITNEGFCQYYERSNLSKILPVMKYAIRCFDKVEVDIIKFYLPQLVQLLRFDIDKILTNYICNLAKSSDLLCHQIIWLLQSEDSNCETQQTSIFVSNSSLKSPSKNHSSYGYCNTLSGHDDLPNKCFDLIHRIEQNLSNEGYMYMKHECT
jgi:hypothetical protein